MLFVHVVTRLYFTVLLAEFCGTVPSKLTAFANATSNLVTSDYRTVATARSQSHEFARSSAIDQIDLVHFAKNLGTAEGTALADTLISAVKYNRTSSNMTNAYGISVYFPYRKSSKVNTASTLYQQIGIDSEYSECIRAFAGLQSAGQAAGAGQDSSPFSMLRW